MTSGCHVFTLFPAMTPACRSRSWTEKVHPVQLQLPWECQGSRRCSPLLVLLAGMEKVVYFHRAQQRQGKLAGAPERCCRTSKKEVGRECWGGSVPTAAFSLHSVNKQTQVPIVVSLALFTRSGT